MARAFRTASNTLVMEPQSGTHRTPGLSIHLPETLFGDFRTVFFPPAQRTMSKTDHHIGESIPTHVDDRWRRHFALLWSGSALAGLGGMTFGLAIPLLALFHTGSPALAGWIAAAGMVPRTLLHIPVGLVVDRRDPRGVMIAGLGGRILCVLLFVGPVLLLDAPVVLLAVASALHGVCSTLYTTAGSAAVPHLVPRDELAGAAAKNQARGDATQMVGRPLGGALYGVAHGLPALFEALSCLLALWASARLPRIRRDRTERPREGLFRELGEGFLLVRGDRFLLLSLVVCTVTNALFQVVWLVIMLMATEKGLPGFLLGLILAATGAGGLLGACVAPYMVRTLDPARMVRLCSWAWLALALLLLASERAGGGWPTVTLPVVWGGIGFVGAHMNVTVTTYHTRNVHPDLLGRLTGTVRFLTGGALPLGLLLGGLALEVLGTRTTVVLITVIIALIALSLTVLRLGTTGPGNRPSRAAPRPEIEAPSPGPGGPARLPRSGSSAPGRVPEPGPPPS